MINAWPSSRRRQHRGGIVLILVLVGLIFIAALMAYVFNLGQQTQYRTKLQNAADAGAVSGPGVVARSFNTIAMNNVGIANLLGMINNLDAMPRTVANTRLDQEAILTRLDEQLGTGIPDPLLRAALERLGSEVAVEVQDLQEMQQLLNTLDVNQITHWDAPGSGSSFGGSGGGTAWQAMSALDAWSQAVAEEAGALAQVAAGAAVEANLSRRVAGAGVMLPAEPAWPMQRGDWWDLEYPVRYGQLPPEDRLEALRRGPYDTLYGWRDGYYRVQLLEVPRGGGGGGGGGSGTGGSAWSGRGAESGTDWQVVGHELLEYGTFGPHDGIQRHLSGAGDELAIIDSSPGAGGNGMDTATGLLYYRMRNPLTGTDRTPNLQVGQIVPRGTRGALHGRLPWSRVDRWHRDVVDAKGRMLWGGVSTENIIEPDWITDRRQAVRAGDQDPSQIRETCYVRVIFTSRFENNALVSGPTLTDTDILWRQGYHPEPPGLNNRDRVANDIWRDEIRDQETRTGPNGVQIQTVTVFQNYFVWIGVNRGEPVAIDNPYRGLDPASAPAPIDFIHDQRPPMVDGLREDLRFMTVAGQATPSELMPTRFDRRRNPRNPARPPQAIALSQSRVFNNHSDDLWTQMWRVQLEPIDGYETWTNLLQDQLPTLATIPHIDSAIAEWMHEQMQASNDAAGVMMRH